MRRSLTVLACLGLAVSALTQACEVTSTQGDPEGSDVPDASTGSGGKSGSGGGKPASWESYQCIDGRIRFSSGSGRAYTRCDLETTGVECVVDGPCPSAAGDAGEGDASNGDASP